ncbi:MAG: hypothetical protein V8S95_02230 [Odoribacter sp.]
MYAYLARHVNYEGIDVMECQGVSPDEWLDGPNDRNIRITTPEKDEVRTETELYKQLCRVEDRYPYILFSSGRRKGVW